MPANSANVLSVITGGAASAISLQPGSPLPTEIEDQGHGTNTGPGTPLSPGSVAMRKIRKSPSRLERVIKTLSKRHERTLTHVNAFMRVGVLLPRSEIRFTVTVEKRNTIEHLCRQIEAEFAFDYPEETLLECGFLSDEEGNVLPFDSLIGDVLEMYSLVMVMNIREDASTINVRQVRNYHYVDERSSMAISNGSTSSLARGSHDEFGRPIAAAAVSGHADEANATTAATSLSSQHALRDATTSVSSESSPSLQVPSGQPAITQGTEDAVKPLAISTATGVSANPAPVSPRVSSSVSSRPVSGPPPTTEERFQAILHNRAALNILKDYCIEYRLIENLLFWLEVETLQGIDPSQRLLMAKFIFLTYVADSAPLRINMGNEIRREITFPVTPNLSIFDDAQEYVYAMLKRLAFSKFEKSDYNLMLQDLRQKGKNGKAHS